MCGSLLRGKVDKMNQTNSFDFKYCMSSTLHDCLSQSDKMQNYFKNTYADTYE